MVSIIIPLRCDEGYLKDCLDGCFCQEGAEIEIVVLPDERLPWKDSRIIQELTGSISPARKRNRGVQLGKGDFLAFIDDDTRPQPGWLKAALVHFNDPQIAAVGGPSMTPQDDPYWAQISGMVYESWVMSGGERRRYRPEKACDIQDFPSCNLIVRRSAFEEVRGFGTDFWPGEDTEFCLALIKKGYRIWYEPNALIEHHRRPSLKEHFVQLANYGLHRGYFVKRYPETSRRIRYFIPSLFVLSGIILSILGVIGNRIGTKILLVLGVIYFLLLLINFISKPLKLILPAMMTTFLSHIVYGISFIRGLVTSRLPEENKNA